MILPCILLHVKKTSTMFLDLVFTMLQLFMHRLLLYYVLLCALAFLEYANGRVELFDNVSRRHDERMHNFGHAWRTEPPGSGVLSQSPGCRGVSYRKSE